MERSLLWSAFALGWVGWLCTVLLTFTRQLAEVVRPDGPQPQAAHDAAAARVARRVAVPLWHLVAAIVAPLLLFLLTLPTRPPFSPGQGWGRGVLLGGIGAGLAAATVLWLQRAAPQGDRDTLRAAAGAGPCFLAVGVTTLPLLWLPLTDVLIDPLVGIACGWFVTSFLLYLGLQTQADVDAAAPGQAEPTPTAESAAPATHDEAALAIASGLGFTLTLCAVTALGVYRNALSFGLRNGTWSVIAVTFAAGVPLTVLISALSGQLGRRALARMPLPTAVATGWPVLLSVLLLSGLGSLLSVKVTDQPKLALVVVLGLGLGGVAWWLARGAATENGVNPPLNTTSLASLVVLCATMVAYQLLQGFGVGLMLLAAWSLVGSALPAIPSEATAAGRRTVPELLRLLLFGVVLLLYRLFSMRFKGDLHSATLSDNYALFGFVAGAVFPALLAQVIDRKSTMAHSGRLILAGTLALAWPGVIVVLWGAKCCLALLAGLAVSIVNGRVVTGQRVTLHTALLAVGVALVLVQWTHRVLPIAELSRTARVHALTYIVVGFLAVLLMVDYGGRIVGWLQRRHLKVAVE